MCQKRPIQNTRRMGREFCLTGYIRVFHIDLPKQTYIVQRDLYIVELAPDGSRFMCTVGVLYRVLLQVSFLGLFYRDLYRGDSCVPREFCVTGNICVFHIDVLYMDLFNVGLYKRDLSKRPTQNTRRIGREFRVTRYTYVYIYIYKYMYIIRVFHIDILCIDLSYIHLCKRDL